MARRDSDDEPVLLMDSESNGAYLVDWLYMDNGYSKSPNWKQKMAGWISL